jgi:hypothetical protein
MGGFRTLLPRFALQSDWLVSSPSALVNTNDQYMLSLDPVRTNENWNPEIISLFYQISPGNAVADN